MAKYFGVIGYVTDSSEIRPGVWETVVVERNSYGDVIRNSRQLEVDAKVNADISVGNSIRIVADAYANENIFAMRYISWMGALWTVDTVEVQRPRLVLRLGGLYNGPTASVAPVAEGDNA